MPHTAPENVTRVGILGTGVIGGAWALHFLRQGLQVVAYDPGPGSEDKLGRMINQTWPTMKRLGLKDGASPDNLVFASSLEELGAEVQVIQESCPEELFQKQDLFASLDALTPAEVVICSSTSGLAMTDIQAKCSHPGRTVVGHPFNPPYIIPLVEVVGGEKTSPECVDWAVDFYHSFGKKPIRMDKELSGFIANRLQEALWREALHMVNAGEATVQEIDDSIRFGPGLRWAIMGPCLTFHLAGGDEGMAHMLDHFGPSLLEPWTRLDAPELTSELRDRMVAGCLQSAEDNQVCDLVRRRDDCLIRIMHALSECGQDIQE
jgi:carnitine 3-dehydrogenase